MGCLIRFAFAAVIVVGLAIGACDRGAVDTSSDQPMDGSTAGANAVTLEDLGIDATEVQHGEARGD